MLSETDLDAIRERLHLEGKTINHRMVNVLVADIEDLLAHIKEQDKRIEIKDATIAMYKAVSKNDIGRIAESDKEQDAAVRNKQCDSERTCVNCKYRDSEYKISPCLGCLYTENNQNWQKSNAVADGGGIGREKE